MKKHLLPMIVVVAAGTMMFAACGDSQGKPAPNQEPTEALMPTEGDWIDLGLPSGIKWASCNVGAESPQEYGMYVAWGEIEEKSSYNWDTYLYADSSYDQLTKYCNYSEYGHDGFSDGITTLQPTDDVATQVVGDGARIPTEGEWKELMDNTTTEWGRVKGRYGFMFTGANGNSIFLPASGYRWGENVNFDDSYGYYWSATLNENSPDDAWQFLFDANAMSMNSNYRRYGMTVRAVR